MIALSMAVFSGCYDFSRPAEDAGIDATDSAPTEAGPDGGPSPCVVRPAHLDDPDKLQRGHGNVIALERSSVYRLDTDAQTLSLCESEKSASCDPLAVSIETSLSELAQAPTTHWFVESLDLPQDTVLQVRGSRALAIIALRDVEIYGRIDASARGSSPGPGAAQWNQCIGDGEGQELGVGGCGDGTSLFPGVYSGGGGGGNLQPGGTGGGAVGKDQATAEAGVAGRARSGEMLDLLIGGGSGGPGGRPTEDLSMRAPGGGGGGALQLTSNTKILIGEDSQLVAVGGGGAAPSDEAAVGGGGGGGAGGYLFLQAPQLELRGALITTGGAGGGGDSVDDTSVIGGTAGADGSLFSDAPAMGGTSRGPDTSPGGAGAGNTAQVAGVPSAPVNTSGDAATGGGGGAAGRIVTQSDATSRGPGLVLLPNVVKEQPLNCL